MKKQKRSSVWPLTRREAAIVKSLEHVFSAAIGLLLSMERRPHEENATENVKMRNGKVIPHATSGQARGFTRRSERWTTCSRNPRFRKSWRI